MKVQEASITTNGASADEWSVNPWTINLGLDQLLMHSSLVNTTCWVTVGLAGEHWRTTEDIAPSGETFSCKQQVQLVPMTWMSREPSQAFETQHPQSSKWPQVLVGYIIWSGDNECDGEFPLPCISEQAGKFRSKSSQQTSRAGQKWWTSSLHRQNKKTTTKKNSRYYRGQHFNT